MEKKEKKTISRLTDRFVEIVTEYYTTINGEDVKLGTQKLATSYVNSSSQRKALQAEQPTNIVDAVIIIWGNTPTVNEPKFP